MTRVSPGILVAVLVSSLFVAEAFGQTTTGGQNSSVNAPVSSQNVKRQLAETGMKLQTTTSGPLPVFHDDWDHDEDHDKCTPWYPWWCDDDGPFDDWFNWP